MQALWMLLASLFFATMGVCIKFASEHFNSFEIVCYRGMVGVVFLIGMTRVRGVSLRTSVPMMHFWRSVVGVTALTSWFYAIAALPLATAVTLNYMSSVWIAAFLLGGALLVQGRNAPIKQQGPLFLAVLAGFGGVAMMLRPTLNEDQFVGAFVGLLSGIFSAFAYLQVAALSRAGEPESRTVFYFSIGAVLAGALGMVFVGASAWHWPSALWLLPIGLLAVLGQLCMTRAYASGATLVVANLQYSGIVFAGIYSLTIFGDQLPLIGWLGMGLIIVSGITATVLRARAVPHAPAEEH
ncbi:MAG: DMT family transporter [Hydrogenophaga sp.]|jgi:S-adenosylmethionine uptake transporter|uniref:DMT family transporter n=1 Tax=Hydrogenophaga sp. TaxID=1904254 RepID=UPI002716CA15|nr:DMT family transporter [Hydrogenophaga sp.]MDO9483488.1 DMT family transporter [Hydrogenophaga sp.]MDP3345629.1 DMT family transporter [Hydrogenophaga sp.]MDP3809006.1 DMT family transporter [Hydrogenophaga sp.]MDP3923331.1 DMT family transporter [Hydrogenophaga sp.]MDZ4238512.1 DMT family transporter [Hydrogenophaga sp.]